MDVVKRALLPGQPLPPQRSGPLVIAHRGASDEEPEHTLRAYRKAFEHGADGVECDVRLTADHHLVCVHDRRVERTSDGEGVVSSLELARLEEFDWASWKTADRPGDTESPESDPERGHLLTLRRLLDTLVDTRQEVVTLIETKHPTRHGNDVENTLVQVLRMFDLDDGDRPGRPHVRMMSFSNRALQRAHKLAPRLPLVYLVDATLPALDLGRQPAQERRRRRARRADAAPPQGGPGLPAAWPPGVRLDRRPPRRGRPLHRAGGRRHHHQPSRPRPSPGAAFRLGLAA